MSQQPVASSQQPMRNKSGINNAWLQAPGSKLQAGFSLIEMIVAVGLFAVVMLVAVGALLSLVDANKKARALESVMNNLNITLDSMVRATRMGSMYNCNSTAVPDGAIGGDCASGGTTFSFAPFGAEVTDQTKRIAYSFSDGRLYKSDEGGVNGFAVTAPEVTITDMKFYVIGTVRRDTIQPKVVIVVKGTAGTSPKTQTTFYIQATAVQRSLDL